MGWSQSYKQGSEEGREEWARAGRQRPRWRGQEGLESDVLGPGRLLLLFQKASTLCLFLFALKVSFFIEVLSHPFGLFWGTACDFGQDKTLNLGSWVLQGSPLKLRFQTPGPQGQRTYLLPISIPYLT